MENFSNQYNNFSENFTEKLKIATRYIKKEDLPLETQLELRKSEALIKNANKQELESICNEVLLHLKLKEAQLRDLILEGEPI